MAETIGDVGPRPEVQAPQPEPSGATNAVDHGQRFWTLLTLCLAFVVLTDWLLWDQPIGWTLGGYGLLLTGVILFWERRLPRSMAAIIITAAVAVLCLQCLEEPNCLTAGLGVLGLGTLAMTLRDGWTASGLAWVHRWCLLSVTWWLCPFTDAAAWYRLRQARGDTGRAGTRWLRNWSLPILLSLVFLALFAVANPVISRWLQDARREILDLLERLVDWSPTGSRLLMWLLVGFGAWALLRFRSGAGEPSWGQVLTGDPPSGVPASPAFAARCLLLFNGLFALQIALDLCYLWGGAQLPKGLTYAQYAHRGAYPLMAAAILAAVFVFAAFRGDPHEDRMRLARRLVYLWLVQNVFLLLSAGWRLWLYVGAYSLTRWRVAAAIWMLLVLCGVVWILIRIAAGRSNRWLINVNAVTALVVLYTCSFGNFDGWIACFNTTHCQEVRGYGEPLDLEYLETLGPDTLPALAGFAKRLEGSPTAEAVHGTIERLQTRLRSDLGNWRGWTWRRHRLAQLDLSHGSGGANSQQ